jgi:glycine amidinotransferase
MPRATLAKDQVDVSYSAARDPEILNHVQSDDAQTIDTQNQEIVFDAAQCLRFGRDVIVNVANSAHEGGFNWLTRMYGARYRFHRLDGVADSHIDSLLMPLRPGLLLVRSAAVRDWLPNGLKKWDMVVAPEPDLDHFPDYSTLNLAISSKFIDMNVLSVNENTVIVNSLYPELVRKLESLHFNVLPVRHRHRRMFGGGFHCFTLDIRRKGGLDAYF